MEIFVVGGAVRDELLGIKPKDIDYVVVGATPDQMIAQGFEQVGADFPVFLHPETKDEYALARVERKAGNGYHGFEVNFDTNVTVEEDLSRRDLTMNAMAKAADGTIIDPFGGQRDLKAKVLRHVSSAFAEDPLRVVRLCRFYARYSEFKIADETLRVSQAMAECGELNYLPHERFWAELEKVMGEKDPIKFFYAVGFTGMDEHTKFFRELYGCLHIHKIAKMEMITKQVIQKFDDPGMRLMFHTALTTEHGSQTIKTASVRTQKLFENIERVREMGQPTPEDIYELLRFNRAWGDSSAIFDLVHALEITEKCDRIFVKPHMIHSAVEASSKVMAEFYVRDFSGKALGEQIAKGRIAAIKQAMEK